MPVHVGEIVSGDDDAVGLLWLDKKFLLNDELAINRDGWWGTDECQSQLT